jgi:hypothetical protein
MIIQQPSLSGKALLKRLPVSLDLCGLAPGLRRVVALVTAPLCRRVALRSWRSYWLHEVQHG